MLQKSFRINIFSEEVFKSKIGRKLAIYSLSIALIPFITFAIFVNSYLTYFLVENTKKSVVKYSKASGQRLFEILDSGRKELEIIKNTMLINIEKLSSVETERYLKETVQNSKEFKWLAIFDKDGKLIISSFPINTDMINAQENVKKSILLGKVVMSSPYINKKGSFSTTALFSPIKFKDGSYYVVAGEMRQEFLWEITRGMYYLDGGNIFILDKDGKILSTSSGIIPPERRLFDKKRYKDLSRKNSGVVIFKDKAKEMICGYYTVFLRGTFFCENWKIIIFKPKSDVIKVIHYLQTGFLSVVVVVLSLLILFIFSSVRKILTPLNLLMDGIRKIKDGNVVDQIKINTKDEIEDIVSSFNEMSYTLREKNKAIDKLLKEMENKIFERTSELQIALDDLKKAQKQIIHKEKMAAIGEIVASIAHEINTPLTSISGYSEALLRRVREGEIDIEYFEKFLRIVRDRALHCKRIIDNLLYFSREKKIMPGLYNIDGLIKESIESISSQIGEKNIDIVYESRKTQELYIDGEQIKQVFLNILLNSIEAIDKEGKILIEVEEDSDKIEVCFEDNGCGIKEEDLSKIFTPFFTTKQDGTGLGLSITQEILRNIGGEIKVESKYGEGSKFTVIIPKNIKKT